MNILITGVAGFIGSNLADRLIKENHRIIGLDNFDGFYDRSIKEVNLKELSSDENFKLYEGSILDNDHLNKLFESEKIDLIIHLAAKAGVRPSIAKPKDYFETNLIGTMNVLEMMKKFSVSKMIFASSSSIYGNNQKVPFSESDIVDFPISPYAASKKAGELLCHTYHHLYDFDIFCLRFFTVYGPRQRPDLAINKFTNALLNGLEIPFYGDGSTLRDYTHVNDIVNGILGAIKNLKGYNVFNLGESKVTSLSQLIQYLEMHTGKKAKLKILPAQEGDVARTFADITKAKHLIGYDPKVDIEEGLKAYVQYCKNLI